jgi:hypothetical protein
MIKWGALDKPKEFGGLGFIDTRAMNTALLCKWIFRFESGDESMCMKLLRRKYLRNLGFCQSKERGSSQFWQGLHSVKDLYEKGNGHLVGSGKQTRFRKDVWLDECPLKVSFPKIYSICNDQEVSVQTAGEMAWNFSYRRCFGEAEMEAWREMMIKLERINLTEDDDKVTWKLEKSKKFSTRSMYRYITFAGVVDVRMMEIWNTKIPLKVKIFLWMAWHDRIQTTHQLKKRNWDKADVCKFCGKEETINHLLFQCPIARAVWCWVKDSLGCMSAPTSITKFQDLFLAQESGGEHEIVWWVMAAVGWALWKTKNDLVFSDIVIKSPKHVAYKSLGFMKQ